MMTKLHKAKVLRFSHNKQDQEYSFWWSKDSKHFYDNQLKTFLGKTKKMSSKETNGCWYKNLGHLKKQSRREQMHLSFLRKSMLNSQISLSTDPEWDKKIKLTKWETCQYYKPLSERQKTLLLKTKKSIFYFGMRVIDWKEYGNTSMLASTSKKFSWLNQATRTIVDFDAWKYQKQTGYFLKNSAYKVYKLFRFFIMKNPILHASYQQRAN